MARVPMQVELPLVFFLGLGVSGESEAAASNGSGCFNLKGIG